MGCVSVPKHMYRLPSQEVNLIVGTKKKKRMVKVLNKSSSTTPSTVPLVSSIEFVYQLVHRTA